MSGGNSVKHIRSNSLRKRRSTFCVRVHEIRNSPKFKANFSKINIDTTKKIIVTHKRLQVLCGKKGFIQAAADLNDGNFSIIARKIRADYISMKLESTLEYVKSSNESVIKSMGETLNSIKKIFTKLSPEIKGKLNRKLDVLFYNSDANTELGAFCGVFGGLSGVVFLGGAIFGVAGIALSGAAGVAVAAVTGAVLAITKLVDNIENRKKYKSDMNILELIQQKLRVITKKIKELNKNFDKYGKATGKLQRFLEKMKSYFSMYLGNKGKIRRPPIQTLRYKVDLEKIWIAKFGLKMVIEEAPLVKAEHSSAIR